LYHSGPHTRNGKLILTTPIRQPTASQSSTLMFGFKQLTHQQMPHTMHA
jgi:hypothetical protein